MGIYTYSINHHINFNILYIQLVFANGIDGVYNKQVMHVYHVITHLYKGSINRRQPYSKIKSISNIVNRTIRCAIHRCHQIIIGSITCSQSPPLRGFLSYRAIVYAKCGPQNTRPFYISRIFSYCALDSPTNDRKLASSGVLVWDYKWIIHLCTRACRWHPCMHTICFAYPPLHYR